MLILHTSDWHLGRTLHHADLTEAYRLWCDDLVRCVEERRIDAVLISGDVYDRSVPPLAAVELFDATLARLAELTTVVMTSGNHDSPHRLGFGSRIMRQNVHIRTDSRDSGTPIPLSTKKGDLGALVYAIPYLDPDVERHRLAPHSPGTESQLDELLERSHKAVLRAALERVKADIAHGEYRDATAPRICMAHTFVTGGSPSSSERDLHVGGIDSAPASLFRLGADGPGPLAYVALGHLHSPQKVGGPADPPMRYSGSPIAFSFSETKPKSSVLLQLDATGISTELIPAPVWRPLTTIKGTLADILSAAADVADHFVKAIVTDPDRPADMAARIRAALPYALEIVHASELTPSPAPAPHALATRDPFDSVIEFLIRAGGRDLSDDERRVAEAAWHKARDIAFRSENTAVTSTARGEQK